MIVDTVFNVLKQHGVSHVVCSPGSRNAQLLLTVAKDKDMKKTVIIDERVAGFIALGMAQVSQEPIALICTSGSAVLNYAPAVAEAFYQGLPLIIISADRPSEWIDQDDSQTIRQYEILKNIVKQSYDINTNTVENTYIWYVNRIVNEGIIKALECKKGPIHLNIHLDGNLRKDLIVDKKASNFSTRNIFDISPNNLSGRHIDELASFAFDKSILIVCGFGLPDHKLQKTINKAYSFENIAIMAETISNLHLPSECYMIDNVICNISEEERKRLKPDIVISIGGALISRKLKEYLRNYNPVEHWSVNNSDKIVDCFQSLTIKLNVNASIFLNSFLTKIKKLQSKNPLLPPKYRNAWKLQRQLCHEKKEHILKRTKWSDLKAFSTLLQTIPEKCNLFLSNGTPIRYAQILTKKLPHATYCNRGVSGIDGCFSTAIGGGMIFHGMSILIIGDMSFIYDIGALVSNHAVANMRVIIISNGGGEIFRFIPITSQLEEREEYFCLNPFIPVRKLAEAYKWEYHEAKSEIELEKVLVSFFKPSLNPKILNIITPKGDINSNTLRKFLNIKT